MSHYLNIITNSSKFALISLYSKEKLEANLSKKLVLSVPKTSKVKTLQNLSLI